jgi:hypothetical protein
MSAMMPILSKRMALTPVQKSAAIGTTSAFLLTLFSIWSEITEVAHHAS